MKHIVIDAREWSTSTGRYISNLVRHLEKIDSENNYTILLKPRDISAWRPANPRFRARVCPYKEFTFAEQLGFKKQLEELRADLVHFGMAQQPVSYRGATVTTLNDLTTLRFTNPSKNPVLFWLKQRVYAWVNKKVAKKARGIITYSQFVKDDVVRFAGINPDKVAVVPLAAEPIAEPAEALPGFPGKQFIMYIGRPMAHKNLERLVKAFTLLRARHPELVLVLAGKQDANYRRIAAAVAAQGLENVVFTGFISEGRLRWLYEHCAAYVFPSLSEGFGLPGLEAMVHGAPVVSSNATCLPEVYGNAAHYFDPLDTAAMADAINEVLTDKILRQKLIARGHLRAAQYSWQSMAEKTLAVYHTALR